MIIEVFPLSRVRQVPCDSAELTWVKVDLVLSKSNSSNLHRKSHLVISLWSFLNTKYNKVWILRLGFVQPADHQFMLIIVEIIDSEDPKWWPLDWGSGSLTVASIYTAWYATCSCPVVPVWASYYVPTRGIYFVEPATKCVTRLSQDQPKCCPLIFGSEIRSILALAQVY